MFDSVDRIFALNATVNKIFLRKISIALTIVLAQAVFVIPSIAAEPPAPSVRYLNYGDAIEVALHDNADLISLREQEESFKVRSQAALAPNNPVLTYTKNSVPSLSLSEIAAQDSYMISYTLGFPGKAFAQSASVRFQAEAAREQAYAKEIDLMTGLSNNFVALANNQKIYEFLLDEQRRDRDLKKLLEKKFASSQAAKVDLLNAEVVSQGIAQSLLENRNEFENLLTQFRQLIRRPEEKNLFPAVPKDVAVPAVVLPFERLTELMMEHRHALRGAQKSVQGAEASLTSARLAAFPDFQLSAGVNIWNQSTAAPNTGVNRDYTLGIGIAIPIFYPFSEHLGLKAAHHDLAAAEASYESARIQSLADLQSIFTGLEASKAELDSLERFVMPAAKSSYDLTLLTYGLGRADYFRLNEARRAWLDSEKALLAKRQTYAQLYNQLLAQVGCDFGSKEGPYACK